jgi:hypothetical protein
VKNLNHSRLDGTVLTVPLQQAGPVILKISYFAIGLAGGRWLSRKPESLVCGGFVVWWRVS